MRLAPDLYWSSKDKPVSNILARGFSANVFVVAQGPEIWLFDCGVKLLGRPQRLIKDMQKDGLNPTKISKVFLSHAHPDHANAADWFVRHFHATVFIHTLDYPMLMEGENYLWKSQSAASRGLDRELWPVPLWLTRWFLSYSMGKYPTLPKGAVQQLNEGEKFEGVRHPMIVIHTPGHTAGHVCFWIPSLAALMGGDLIDPSYDHKASLNFPDCNYQAIYRSIQRLLPLDIQWYCAAHARIIPQGSQACRELCEGTLKKLDLAMQITIDALKSAGKTGIRIREFYGKYPKAVWLLQDQTCVPFSIIKELEKENKVVFTAGRFYWQEQ